MKSKIKKVPPSPPLILKHSTIVSKQMKYALLGVITEVVSDREKEKREKLLKDPNAAKKIDKLDDTKIVEDIYTRLMSLYPTSTFNVVIINLVGGEFQFTYSRDDTTYIQVQNGSRIFMIFKIKN